MDHHIIVLSFFDPNPLVHTLQQQSIVVGHKFTRQRKEEDEHGI
jgi:hypothetical protein